MFKVEVEVCPECGGPMRIVGFVTAWASVRRIQGPLERIGIEARAGSWEEAAG